MTARTRDGRRLLDRHGVAALTHASPATIARWYQQRARTGFPEAASTDPDGRRWWTKADIEAFHAAHLAERATAFSRVDRRGDPNDLLTAPQAAKVLGYRNHRSLPDLMLDNPDRVEELPSGRLRRLWHRRTVWAYADTRPLRHSTGRPTGTGTGPRTSHPYANDPRLQAAATLLTQAGGTPTRGLGTQLARQLGIGERTALRLIHAARLAVGATLSMASLSMAERLHNLTVVDASEAFAPTPGTAGVVAR